MRRALPGALALILMLALASGCSSAMLGQAGQARLRTLDAIPDGPAVNVVADGNPIFSNVAFSQVTAYQARPAAPTSLQVVPSTGQPALITTSANLRAATDYTFIATGMLANPEPLLLTDDNSPPPSGQARVRFVQVSPNTPPVDVTITGGATLFQNVPYKGEAGYIALNAGTFSLELRQAGTSTVLLSVPNVSLTACNVYTIFAVGLLNGQPRLQTVVSTDAVTACAAGGVPPAGGAAPGRTVAPLATGVLTPTLTSTARTPSATPSGTTTSTGTTTPTSGTPTTTGTPALTASATVETTTPMPTNTPLATEAATAVMPATEAPTEIIVPTAAVAATVGMPPTEAPAEATAPPVGTALD